MSGLVRILIENTKVPSELGFGSYEFCTRLLGETGVMFTPGAAFDIEHTIRIGFADDTETLCTGLELVGQFLDRFAQD